MRGGSVAVSLPTGSYPCLEVFPGLAGLSIGVDEGCEVSVSDEVLQRRDAAFSSGQQE